MGIVKCSPSEPAATCSGGRRPRQATRSNNGLLRRQASSSLRPRLCPITLPVILLLCITACSRSPTEPEVPVEATSGPYTILSDAAPVRPIGPEDVADAIPRADPILSVGNRSPYTVNGIRYDILEDARTYRERGIASWYGIKFHGHKTSNGEIYDLYQASAAHKTLPIPSYARVTNLGNGRSIVVRVNDRGPFHGDRLIDLSYAAAVKLDYADSGTARVQLDAIVAPTSGREKFVAQRTRLDAQRLSLNFGVLPAGEQYLQVGAFAELGRAQEVSNQLRTLTDRPVFIRSVSNASNGVLHRVRVGPVSDPGEIRQITQRVVAANLGSPYTITQ